MRLSGVTGHRVFVQDSDRPVTGIMSIYTVHRRHLEKPEKKMKGSADLFDLPPKNKP